MVSRISIGDVVIGDRVIGDRIGDRMIADHPITRSPILYRGVEREERWHRRELLRIPPQPMLEPLQH